MIIEISIVVVCAAFVILILYLIPTIIQFKRSARSLEESSNQVNQKLPDILNNLEEITANFNSIMSTGRRQVEVLSDTVDEIKLLIDNIIGFQKHLQTRIENPLIETLTTITALSKALRAFLTVMLEKKS
jgi:uncharacterized protein YoxC